MAEIILTSQNFEQEVLQSPQPVLVDFWAAWCGPCKMLGPVIHEIAEEYDGRVKVGKVNIDEEMELAQRYHIASIPTVILFKDGQAAGTSVGFKPKKELEKMLG